jgi:hypothetical protein
MPQAETCGMPVIEAMDLRVRLSGTGIPLDGSASSSHQCGTPSDGGLPATAVFAPAIPGGLP